MHDKYWTWVHWELDVCILDFVHCEEVLCRAWDWSQNTQPSELTWTLLGQGNNSHFRLKCHKEVNEKVHFLFNCGTAEFAFVSLELRWTWVPSVAAAPPPLSTSAQACYVADNKRRA
jgi:hypothetical protein